MSGLGAVYRDGSGGVLSGDDVQVRAKWEAHMAEACAVMDGVLMARSLGLQRVIAETPRVIAFALCKLREKKRKDRMLSILFWMIWFLLFLRPLVLCGLLLKGREID